MKKVFITALILFISNCGDGTQTQHGWYGTVERDRHSLSAPVSGILTGVYVRDGDTVQPGQLLIQFDQTAALAQVQIAEAQLAEAQAMLLEAQHGPRAENLAVAQARVEGAQAALRDTEQRLQRTRQLVNTGASTQAELDQIIAARDLARSQLSQANQLLAELQSGTRSEQLLQAEARISAAQGRLAVAQQQRQDLSLYAAHDAVVDNLPWRTGDRVNQGAPLISMLANHEAYVRVYVPATALPDIAVGTTLLIRTAPNTADISGTVRHVRAQPAFTPYYALNERDRARLMYLTEINLPTNQQSLPSGLPVEVRLP